MKLTMLIIFSHCSYYVDINSAGISNFYKDFTKTRLLDSWFSPYNDTSIFYWNVLPKAGFNAQKSLIRSKELIMSKAFINRHATFLEYSRLSEWQIFNSGYFLVCRCPCHILIEMSSSFLLFLEENKNSLGISM